MLNQLKTPLLPYQDQTVSIHNRVEDLLERMSLYEKIGQMTQLDITLINKTGHQQDVELNPTKARDLLLNHHIGSFMNGEAVPPKTWFNYMRELMRISVEETRLGIPIIYGIDHIHGATYLEGATIFPQAINLGATFNPNHAYNTGFCTALESADLCHHWGFAPVLDVGVNPLWPRLYETFGEDPFMAGVMGAAFVKGYQENTDIEPYKVAATGKHFLGYSDPRSGRDRTPANISMQQIHEVYRVPFQMAIDAGLKTIMLNSGEINGVPVHASYEILTRLLREQMGFEGVIVTDWEDIEKLVNFHYTSPNYTEATFAAVQAGIDVNMTPLSLEFNSSLLELVENGRIQESRIDESVRRVLKLKFELGLFEHPFPRNDRFERVGNSENKQKALDAARESIVLLKNEGVLPAKHPSKIAIFGPSANSKRNLSGGWTLAWQGGNEKDYPQDMLTIYSATKAEFPHSEVKLFSSDDFPHTKTSRSAFIKQLDNYDLILYAGGEEPYTEFIGNIDDLNLPFEQRMEIKFLSQSNTPLLLILVQGRPRLIHTIMDDADAILHAGLPGFEGGEAIANIISGKVNPSGKMPVSYPMSPHHYLPYNHKKSAMYNFNPDVANQIVQENVTSTPFPFGFGLSYMTFEYSGLTLNSALLPEQGSITASLTITNTGSSDGMESVLWFISTHFGRISRPVKELKHFGKIALKAGESTTVSFKIKASHLMYPDEHGNPILEKHGYSLTVGNLSCDFNVERL